MIECKSSSKPNNREIEKLQGLATETGCKLVIATKKRRKIKITEVFGVRVRKPKLFL
jgi:hypothetical protein